MSLVSYFLIYYMIIQITSIHISFLLVRLSLINE